MWQNGGTGPRRAINVAWNSTIATNFKASKDNIVGMVSMALLSIRKLSYGIIIWENCSPFEFRFILDKTQDVAYTVIPDSSIDEVTE